MFSGGLYGGTFDPIHLGHCFAAERVRQAFHMKSVRMVLSANPPHKEAKSESILHRWKMLELACEDYPNLVPDDSEIRWGSSYTIDTLKSFGEAHGTSKFFWILGQDSFVTLPEWRGWQQILHYCSLIVVNRSIDSGLVAKHKERLLKESRTTKMTRGNIGTVFMFDLEMLKISSSDIRKRLREGDSTEGLLDSKVAGYIDDHELYCL
jgi:nicotinate-nucleotide adenylyltransferase